MFDTAYISDINGPFKGGVDSSYRDLLLFMIQSEADSKGELQSQIDQIKAIPPAADFVDFIEKCQETSLLPKRFDGLAAGEIQHALVRLYPYYFADKQYSMEQVSIRIHLFATRQDDAFSSFLGWDAILPENQIRSIPISGNHHSMFKPPHVETFGSALTLAMREAAHESQEQSELKYFPLVTLKQGRNYAAPLFCLPGAGGNVTSFTELTAHLDKEWTVYGLQPRGLDSILVPHSTISAAVESYIRMIDKIYPEGPINLFGHSFGRWVAFELAQRLRKSGRHIASLTILDSELPEDDLVSR